MGNMRSNGREEEKERVVCGTCVKTGKKESASWEKEYREGKLSGRNIYATEGLLALG